jgi:hypothetical protein
MGAGTGFGTSLSTQSTSGMGFNMLGSSGVSTAVKGAASVYGMLASAEEFARQIGAHQMLMQNTAEMVIVQRDQQLFDLRKRIDIISGSAVARAGRAGVTISGSVVNQVADIATNSAIEKMRINLNAANTIKVLKIQQDELNRQKKKRKFSAALGSVLTVAGAVVGGVFGGPGGAMLGASLGSMAGGAVSGGGGGGIGAF